MTGLEVLHEQKVKTKIGLWASLVAQMVRNLPAVPETWLHPWVGQIPWRREGQPTPVFLPITSLMQPNWKSDFQATPGKVMTLDIKSSPFQVELEDKWFCLLTILG